MVNCGLDIATSGVVIRNSFVNGSIDTFDDTDSVSVVDSTIDAGDVNATSNTGARAIMDRNFSLLRVETIRGVSGGWCNTTCTIKDSWIHAQDKDEGGYAHMSGFRQGGGSLPNSQQFLHNSIACDAPVVEPDAGCSADITGYGDFETVKNNLLEKNLLMESPEGAFCAYGGSSGSSNGAKPYPYGANNVWRNNIFQHGAGGKCASFAPMTDLDPGVRGNVWDNNRWNTGELLPVPD